MTPKMFPSVLNWPAVVDFAAFEADAYRKGNLVVDGEIISKLQLILSNPEFLDVLRAHARQCAMRYEGMRTVNIRLPSGNRYPVSSPLFVKARPKDKRRRKYRANVCLHLGLLYLGIREHCSPTLQARAISLAALCPSFDIACDALRIQGIEMNHTFLQRLSYNIADDLMLGRAEHVVDDEYRKPGLRILIAIDGGRLRERKRKKGRKPKNAKRQGYTAEWREPKLFTICLTDENGKKRKDVAPIYDGAVTGPDEIFKLLTEYLNEIDYCNAAAVTFCADGGAWIWPRVDQLIKDLQIPTAHCVLDYTHAKQNLMDIADYVHQACGVRDCNYDDLVTKLKAWLWNGDIDKIRKHIETTLRRKRVKKQAIKKLNDYFGDPAQFQYAAFRAQGLPTGSGAIESAIRRIINLRIKGPGIFWLLPNADRMIFLRSQILSGRWRHVLKSATKSWRNQMKIQTLQTMAKTA